MDAIGTNMNTHILQNDQIQIEYLTEPMRIIGMTPAGKTNMLADLGDLPVVPTPYGDFHFRGGHRLWHAPEAMPRTYIPDTPVTVTPLPDGVLLDSQAEPGTGIRKKIEIQLSADAPALTLTHVLINDGLWPVELAPGQSRNFAWAGWSSCPCLSEIQIRPGYYIIVSFPFGLMRVSMIHV